MQCPQSARVTSLWRRGLLTGLCPACRKAPSSKIRSRLERLRRIALTAAVVLAVVAVGYCTPLIRGPLTDSPFSSEAWASGDVRVRGRLAGDIASSGYLHGKSGPEVRATLGPPDAERFGGQTIRYRIDLGYRWVIRPYMYDLVVRFGKADDVFQVAIEPSEAE